jgi:hypothetical protein
MTDQEKVARHDTIDEIRTRIGGCFGTADGIFAGHPSDEKRAKDLRKLASNNNLTLQEVREIALSYLYGKGYIAEHISKQMDKVNKLFGTKLH